MSVRSRSLFLFPIAVVCLVADLAAAGGPAAPLAEAQRELFAARYENAARLYSKIVAEDPANGDAWCGLVKAELAAHHSREAYAAAAEALNKAPQSAGAHTAAALAAFRRGDLPTAEHLYHLVLKTDGNYAPALSGLARVYSAVSMFKTARGLRLHAYHVTPDDPSLMETYASTLKGEAHVAMLLAALRELDPASEEARALAAHIANEKVAANVGADHGMGRLVSPYEPARLKLYRILDGPRRARGVGLAVRLNDKATANLLLDSGASGVAISPKLAEKAGLEAINGAAFEIKGIGDSKAQSTIAYIARDLCAGDVAFADYPIAAFQSAKSADFDGLIGPDVFRRFIVKIDFPQLAMELQPRPNGASEDAEEPVDFKGSPATGFYRVFRFGDHLAVPTFINGGRSALFLVDSGSSSNLIDTETAREFTKVDSDSRTVVKGIQGRVDQTSRANRISLVFAGFRQDNPDLIAISLEKMSDSMGIGFGGILGMPVLGQLAVTVDYREGTIRLDYKKP
ncbi:MAG TPA: retropepsin-like aspartic protease [Bryobacteraceae bacterium]|nr:retropepsin-like aspartic protease [Bryobacteraceae bacterium]